MATIATCPRCNTQVFIPEEFDFSAVGKCPSCRDVMVFSAASLREVPELLQSDVPTAGTESTSQVAPDTTLASGTDSSSLDSLRSIFARTKANQRDAAGEVEGRSYGLGNTASEAEATSPTARSVDSPSFDLPAGIGEVGSDTTEFRPRLSDQPASGSQFNLDAVNLEQPAEAYEPAAVSEVAETAAPEYRKRRRSPLRKLVGVLLVGCVGLGLGYYGLLRLGGRNVDFLGLADHLPPQLLPESRAADSDALTETSTSAPPSFAAEMPEWSPSDAISTGVSTDRYGVLSSDASGDAAVGHPAVDEEVEPAAFADTTPTQLTAPPEVLGAPRYVAADLAEAFQAAADAQAGLVSGSLSDGTSVRRTKGLSYVKFCNLALVLTFLDQDALEASGASQFYEAGELIHDVLSNEQTCNDIAAMARVWLDSQHRTHGGILLVGTISGGRARGSVYEYWLDSGDGEPTLLLLAEPLDETIASGNRLVGVVGCALDQPQEHIAGYDGTASRAIWTGRLLPL